MCIDNKSLHGPRYTSESLDNETLILKIEDVEESLQIKYTKNVIRRLVNGLYVHVYGHYFKCSDVSLSDVDTFFDFTESHLDLQECGIVNVRPFIHSNSGLQDEPQDNERNEVSKVIKKISANEGKYFWVNDPAMSWSWNENVWSTRLFHCIKESPKFSRTKIIPAYQWHPRSYGNKLKELFGKALLHASPFHGMTDILIFNEHTLCCIEVGIQNPTTCTIETVNEKKK